MKDYLEIIVGELYFSQDRKKITDVSSCRQDLLSLALPFSLYCSLFESVINICLSRSVMAIWQSCDSVTENNDILELTSYNLDFHLVKFTFILGIEYRTFPTAGLLFFFLLFWFLPLCHHIVSFLAAL